jgi:hypothetical protein
MSNNIVYWKMRNGELISVDEMDINHLRNVLKMIVNNSSNRKKSFVLNGDAANMFNDDMQNYQDECDATEIDIY